ncbi:MAG: LCP family protein [Clostridia bacterium]|nr:LCP family protein [Clostridia bacterium]
MFKYARKKLLSLLLIAGVLSGIWLVGQRLQSIVRTGSEKIAVVGGAAIRAVQNAEEAGNELVEAATATEVNFLITGIDDAWSGSDVIMLASLDVTAGSVRIVQIPRDTYINRPGNSNHKLNSVFANAAAEARSGGQTDEQATHTASRALVSFLETNLGVEIDHYVTISTGGLRAVVDAIGGVTVNVPMDIDYDDNSQDLHIHLRAGEQVLDGKAAEQFVRFRSGYLTADYGRMDAQKIFLSALFRKIKNEFTLSTAIKLATSCFRHTESDLGLVDLIPLIRGAMQVSEENVKMITLKGQSAKDENGVVCEVLSREYAIDLLTDYLLPRGAKSSQLKFDPNGVFTAPGEIDRIYQSESPFNESGVSADDADSIKIR